MTPDREFRDSVERALAGVSPRVVVLSEVGSTNDEAKALAREGAPHLSTVVADSQTSGRGRAGRSWVSPRGAGLTTSFVVRPRLPVESWTLLPLITGVAAAEAVAAIAGLSVALKWPNDLRVRGRKVGGILVEAEPPRFAVVGIGINIARVNFPEELREIATTIEGEGGSADRALLLREVMTRFAALLNDPEGALRRYREMCETLGRDVRVERAGVVIEGTATGIGGDGALEVRTAAGVARVTAGDVTHVRDA